MILAGRSSIDERVSPEQPALDHSAGETLGCEPSKFCKSLRRLTKWKTFPSRPAENAQGQTDRKSHHAPGEIHEAVRAIQADRGKHAAITKQASDALERNLFADVVQRRERTDEVEGAVPRCVVRKKVGAGEAQVGGGLFSTGKHTRITIDGLHRLHAKRKLAGKGAGTASDVERSPAGTRYRGEKNVVIALGMQSIHLEAGAAA